MEVAYIINPYSAKGKYHKMQTEILKSNANALILISKSIEDSQNFIKKNWDTIKIFVAIGGDGTISVIAKELLHSDKILAAIPMGSGNGFARESGFLIKFDELLKKLKNGKFTLIDSVLINDALSINVSGCGIDSLIVKKFEKTSRGFFNYVKLSIKTFFEKPSINIEFEEKFKNYNGEYMMLNVANTKQFGNNSYISPQSKVDDGLVNICLIKTFPLSYSVGFVYKMFTKSLKNDTYYKNFTCNEIQMKINTKDWHIDGEYSELSENVKLKVLPKSLRILV